ncbi:MAG: hypothetical protein AAF637_21975 [Pseudomonadota bacterium]
MPTLRETTTAVIARGDVWEGTFATEPYEAPWAASVIVFLRLLKADGSAEGAEVEVQISPDGQHWVGEGTTVPLPTHSNPVTFAKVTHFGNWLRLAGSLPNGVSCQVVATLQLEG